MEHFSNFWGFITVFYLLIIWFELTKITEALLLIADKIK